MIRYMKKIVSQPTEIRKRLYSQIGNQLGLNPISVEKDLWVNIRHHRSVFTPIRGIDYDTPIKKNLRLTPPSQYMSVWKDDYKVMQEQMVYGRSVSFEQLLGQ